MTMAVHVWRYDEIQWAVEEKLLEPSLFVQECVVHGAGCALGWLRCSNSRAGAPEQATQ